MAAPDDADDVRSAVRLGWYLAEVRGRNRPDGPSPSRGSLPERNNHELPLRIERTSTELRIEAQNVLAALAKKLLDDDAVTLANDIDKQAKLLSDGRKKPLSAAVLDDRWKQLAEKIFEFDAHAQDVLTSSSETQACGYQLGRGLSECYWALDVEKPPYPADQALSRASWTFLLGASRCDELARLAGRLAAYFSPYTAAAVAGTLAAWQSIASTPDWRRDTDARDALYGQIRRWYEIVVLRQDPSSLVKPYAVLRNFRAVVQGVRAFLPQLVLATASLAAVAWLIDLLSTSSGNAVGKSALGIAGALGLSGTGISASLKNAAQSLTKRIKQDAFSDLVAAELTVAPKRSGPLTKLPGAAGRKSNRMIRRRVKRRTLTTASAPPP